MKDEKIDALKGLLIILVIVGHCTWQNECIQHVIFWVHMPAFFCVSGFLYHPVENISNYARKKFLRLFPPYLSWYCINAIIGGYFLIPGRWFRFLWGGRFNVGVYWFITVLFLTQILFAWIEHRFKRNTCICILFILLIIACFESNYFMPTIIPDGVSGLIYRIPENADVTLAAVFFYGIGYYYKLFKVRKVGACKRKYIKSVKCAVVAISVVIWCVCVSLKAKGIIDYRLDMKNVIYGNIGFTIILPLTGVICLSSLILLLPQFINRMLCQIGNCSLIIMYTHMQLISFLEDIIPMCPARFFIITMIILLINLALFEIIKKSEFLKKALYSGLTIKNVSTI